MATEVKLPELGENILSGDVIKILVKAGETIKANQAVLEIETDKAAIEVPSPIGGKVESVHVKVGQKAKVGQTILSVQATNGASAKSGATAATSTKSSVPAKSAGATTKAPTAGATSTINPISPAPMSAVTALPSFAGAASREVLIAAAPSTRRLARQMGIDLTTLRGSGLDGRITAADLQSMRSGGGRMQPALPDFSKWGEISKQPLSNVRRATAENLSRSWPLVPQVTHSDQADVTDLEAARRQHNEKSPQSKITFTAILLKVVADALQKFPQFNASIDLAQQQIISKKYISIGVAVDTDRGLLVPVLRQVGQKGVIALAAELTALSEKARSKKIHPDEMTGGNFTISNLGGIGGHHFTPIVNAPESAILGVSRNQTAAVYIKDQFVPRTMLPLALSYDHRLIDGADAARFLRWICETLEQPATKNFK